MANLKPDPQAPVVQDALQHALKRQKRRQRRWLAVKLLVFLLFLLGGALIYLQSSHALLHLYLPLVSDKLGARITAEEGSVGLGGGVWLKNVEMLGTDDKPAFTADRIELSLAPSSLLPGHQPIIRQATVTAAQARVTIDAHGHTNWEFKPKAAPAKTAPPAAVGAAAPKPSAAPFPALTLGQLKLTHSAIQIKNAQQLDLTLTDLDLVLDHFGRGQTGTFGLAAEGYLDRPGIHHRFSIGDGKGSLTADAAGLGLDWQASLSAQMQPEPLPGVTTQTVTLQAGLAGKRSATGRLEQNFKLASATEQGAAGQFTGAITWDAGAKERNATLVASNVGRELLNPLLAALGDVQLASSQLNGQCAVKGAGDVLNLQAAVTGRNLAFFIGQDKTPTPAVNLDFAQRGALDLTRQVLHLDTTSLTLQEGGQPVLVSQLDRPADLQLAAATAPVGGGASARINTTLKQLPLQTLQPWLIMAGLKQAQGVQAGLLNGQILSVVDDAGAAITLDGRLTGSGVRLPAWPGLPLELNHTLQGRIDKLETLSLSQARMTFANAGRILADLDASGNYRFAHGQGQLAIKLVCPQALLTARTLGLLSQTAASADQEGRLESSGELTLAGRNKPARLKGTADLAGLALAGNETLELAGKAEYKISVSAGRLAVEAARAQWTQGAAAEPSVAEVKGEWPLAAGKEGQLKLIAQKVDLAPWLRRGAAASPDSPAPNKVLADADQTLQALAGGGTRLSGQVRVTTIQYQGLPDGTDSLKTLTLTGEASRTNERIDKLTLEAAGETRSGAADKIALSGTGEWTDDALTLNLNGRVESLHADACLPLARLLPGTAGKASAALAPAIVVAAAVPLAAPAVPPQRSAAQLVIAVSPLDIDRLVWQGHELSKAKGTFRYENGVSQVKLNQGTFSGGSLTGNAQYDAARQEPRYAWDVALKQAEIKPLLELVEPELAGHFSGRGDLQSRGSGQGSGADGKRRLQCDNGFALANGEISNFPFLEELAEQTRTDSFRTLQYREFRGRTSIADGIATLTDWSERGPDQRLRLEGTVSLDGDCNLTLEPGLSKALAGRLARNDLAQQLLSDQQGFITLPAIPITGPWPNLKVGSLPVSLGKEGKAQINEELRTTLKDVIGQKLQKQQNKENKEQKPKQKKDGALDAIGSGNAKKMKTKDLVNQFLQDRADKAAKRKNKKTNTREEIAVPTGSGKNPSINQ